MDSKALGDEAKISLGVPIVQNVPMVPIGQNRDS